MKKYILNLLMLFFFVGFAKAQQGTIQVQAIINADGTKGMNIKDATGKVTKLSAADDISLQKKYLDFIKQRSSSINENTIEQKPQIISHRAVLGLNGKQQIVVTFASGKEVSIAAVEGQTIQETYLAYLKKEGLACGCSPVSASEDNGITTRTATRDGSLINQ